MVFLSEAMIDFDKRILLELFKLFPRYGHILRTDSMHDTYSIYMGII